MQELRPKQILKDISHRWPNAWQQVKQFRAGKGKDLPDWPDWCYIPLAAGMAIATQGRNDRIFQASMDTRLNPAVITAAAAWRVSQGVYRYDRDLYNSLTQQPLDDKLPCEALHRLPEWCVYVETYPDVAYAGGSHIIGFWAHLEQDQGDLREELRFVFFWDTGELIPLSVHLGDWTLEDGLQRFIAESKLQAVKIGIELSVGIDDITDVVPYVQLVLYLCADNVDMPKLPKHPSGRVRMSGQVDVPRQERYWTVGERIGAAIRKYQNESNTEQGNEYIPDSIHARPRPHIRRAHWHHFWTGPRQGKRKLILHWLPPIPVGVDDTEGPAVIHKVERGE
jgi:hypothetical protein